MTAITLTGLTKRFGATVAVDAVDLVINAAELFFLLGPSGCGKTTLLRLVAGLAEPDAGAIAFGAETVTRVPPNRRSAGMVFQSYALWPHMTVFDNVAYGLRVRRLGAAARRERVMRALETVHMDRLAQRRPGELSGGQQQRVALARALVVEPSVLLLDEPLSNLDAKLRLEMRGEIRRVCAEARITTIYVTHDQKEALSMADRVAVMASGRIVQVGRPRALYERPESRFVADFLGETNLLPAVVRGTDGPSVRLETPAGAIRSAAGMLAAPTGGNVTCSVRPESIRVEPAGPAAPAGAASAAAGNRLAGRLIQSLFLGEVAQHLVELADGSVLRSLELQPRAFGPAGEPVRVEFDPDDVVILSD